MYKRQNLLKPELDGKDTPRWQSKQTNNVYPTAWQIEFSPNLKVEGLPSKLYMYALCENSEVIIMEGSGFFEGAAYVYEDENREKPFGHAFVEQMGYN